MITVEAHELESGTRLTATSGIDGRVYITRMSGTFSGEQIGVLSVIPYSDQMGRSVGGAVGWGIAGGIATGGIGLLLGAAFGARKKGEAYFIATATTGEKIMLRVTKAKEVKKITAYYIQTMLKPTPKVTPKVLPPLINNTPKQSRNFPSVDVYATDLDYSGPASDDSFSTRTVVSAVIVGTIIAIVLLIN